MNTLSQDNMLNAAYLKNIIVLHSASRYITWVALGNCVDYFISVKCIGSNTEPIIEKGVTPLIFRRFLNAIESLNNIPDYLYHDGICNDVSLGKYRERLGKKYSILREISELANAYKHRIRGKAGSWPFEANPKTKNAKDIILEHEMIGTAFEFWAKFADKLPNGKISQSAYEQGMLAAENTLTKEAR